MKIEDAGREVAYPFANLAVLLALVMFALLFNLALAAGVLGVWLGFIILPAFFRYALFLLEARAQGHDAPAPGIEAFSLVDNFWAVFPAVLPCAFIWLEWRIMSGGSFALAGGALLAFLLMYPASMAVLAVTRSPLQSVNPLAVWRMVRLCGSDYWWIPGIVVPLTAVLVWLARVDLPFLLFDVAANYVFVLMFTLTGAVLFARDAMQDVEIELALEKTDEESRTDLLAARKRVASHAYGFISRDNRTGGFAHIRQWLEREANRDEAYGWFFREMLTWESKLPALFFAQDFLHQLLCWQMEREALKLISRCLHEDADWLPARDDRPAVRALLEKHGRNDLSRRMPSL